MRSFTASGPAAKLVVAARAADSKTKTAMRLGDPGIKVHLPFGTKPAEGWRRSLALPSTALRSREAVNAPNIRGADVSKPRTSTFRQAADRSVVRHCGSRRRPRQRHRKAMCRL